MSTKVIENRFEIGTITKARPETPRMGKGSVYDPIVSAWINLPPDTDRAVVVRGLTRGNIGALRNRCKAIAGRMELPYNVVMRQGERVNGHDGKDEAFIVYIWKVTGQYN